MKTCSSCPKLIKNGYTLCYECNGKEIDKSIIKLFVNTHGKGVDYLHVRLDLKYDYYIGVAEELL